MSAASPSPPRVVVIGGGFGGLAVARALGRAPVEVVLIDRRNHHLFQPLLYQVASAALAPGDIAAPIRSLLARYANVSVMLGEVQRVDLEQRLVHLDDRVVSWDRLVIAAGARHSYFGHDDWERHAPGLKTLDDALEIRQQILLAFERAEWTEDPAERRRLLSFVVVGGGPTGVELAGAIAEIATKTLSEDFRRISPERATVTLIEAGPALLAAFPASLQRAARDQLQSIGVQVKVGRRVVGVDPDGVLLAPLAEGAAAERVAARTTLWGAGVAGSPLGRSLGVPLDRSGRVVVTPELSVPGHPDAFVIGDLASFSHQTGRPLPGVAQVALQMGRCAADNVLRGLRNQP